MDGHLSNPRYDVSALSRQQTKGRLRPGPPQFNRKKSLSLDGTPQMMVHSVSFSRVTGESKPTAGVAGIARSLASQRPNYQKPPMTGGIENQGGDFDISPVDVMHVGVCPKCKVTIDSTRSNELQVCTYTCNIRETARLEILKERKAEKKAETSLGISATKRTEAERREFDKWQMSISGGMSNTKVREKSLKLECCVCLFLTMRDIKPTIETNPSDPRPLNRKGPRVLLPSLENSQDPELKSRNPDSVNTAGLPVMPELPHALDACAPCAARFAAMDWIRGCFEGNPAYGTAMVGELGSGEGARVEEACRKLLELYAKYREAGRVCWSLLDQEYQVDAVFKRCKAVLVSTNEGVAWFAEHFVVALVDTKGVLDLSRSDLREVVDLTPLGTHLVALDVSHNRLLAKLPVASLCTMPSLTSLECSGCKSLLSPPQEIARQGSSEVMAFLRAVFVDGEVNAEVLLFTIGDGEAGKTSTVKALMSDSDKTEAIGVDDRTVGVDITQWKPTIGDGDLKYQIFDMAGQAVYAVTHQCFLAERAIYMLCWRAKYIDQDTDLDKLLGGVRAMIENWTDMIHNRVPGVPVILVVTHIDCVSADQLKVQVEWVRNVARERRERIVLLNDGVSYPINNRAGHGVAELRRALVGHTIASRGYKEALPGTWIKLRDQLREQQQAGTKWLTLSVYRQMATDCGLAGKMLVVATRFLHETGSIRYFGDVASICDLPSTPTDSISVSRSSSSASVEVDDAGAEDALQRTIFISAPWMVNVLKGLVRHEREVLLDYFGGNKDRAMMRRVQRLIVFGSLHESLVPYLWPAAGAATAFWDKVKAAAHDPEASDVYRREAALWNGVDIVSTGMDLERAVSLLAGFNLLTPAKEGEYAVPTLISKERRSGIDQRAFSTVDCPFSSSYNMASIPPGFVEGIAVRLWRNASHTDYSHDSAAFYSRGAMAQMFVTERAGGLMGRKRFQLTVRASTRRFWRLVKSEVERMGAFFPGMPNLRVEKEGDMSNIREPVEVLLLSSEGKVDCKSLVIPCSAPIIQIPPHSFMDAPNRINMQMMMLLHYVTMRITHLTMQCSPPPMLPPHRAAPKLSTLNKLFASLTCKRDTVSSPSDLDSNSLYWFYTTHSKVSSMGELCAAVSAPGVLWIDVTHTVDCVIVQQGERILNEVLAELVVDFALDILPWYETETGGPATRELLALKDAYGDEVGSRISAIDFLSSLLGDVCSQILSEVLASVLQDDIGLDGLVEVMEVKEGKLWSDGDDGRILGKACLMSSGGYVFVSYERGGVIIKPDRRNVQDLFVSEPSTSASHSEVLGHLLLRNAQRGGSTGGWSLSAVDLTGPDRVFNGQVRVVCVLVDQAFGRNHHCVQEFKRFAMEGSNVAVIALIMPGFHITDYRHWWPDTMDAMSKYALFVDLRDPNVWESKVRMELMPQIVKFLEEWRGSAPEAGPTNIERRNSGGSNELVLDTKDIIECTACFLAGVEHPHKFSRSDLFEQHQRWEQEWLDQMDETHSHWEVGEDVSAPDRGGHIVVCSYGHRVQCSELLSVSFIRESVPCPQCVEAEDLPPLCFVRKDLLLYFSEDNTNKVGTVRCDRCRSQGRPFMHRIMDVLHPEVFLSYNWGRKVVPEDNTEWYWSTQRLVTAVQRRIEMEADITCWLDVAGGMGAGQSIAKEMLEGVKKAGVCVVFLSDAYVVSRNCRLEMKTAISSGKFIVPVLISGVEGAGLMGYCDGWTGCEASNPTWWKHAYTIADDAATKGKLPKNFEEDFVLVQWAALGQFRPIDLRDEEMEFGALLQGSCGFDMILRKVLSRLHRGEYIQAKTDAGYDAWRRAGVKIQQMMAEMEEETKHLSRSASAEEQGLTVIERKLQRIFCEIDADASGSIDEKELRAALLSMGISMTESEVAVMMRQVDDDGSGQIEFNEFLSMFGQITQQ